VAQAPASFSPPAPELAAFPAQPTRAPASRSRTRSTFPHCDR
jgi:hypothetical protein